MKITSGNRNFEKLLLALGVMVAVIAGLNSHSDSINEQASLAKALVVQNAGLAKTVISNEINGCGNSKSQGLTIN